MGADVIGVAGTAQYQAEHLMATSIGFRLYLDHERQLYKALGITSQGFLAFIFNMAAWMRYLRALVRNKRQYRITGHYSTLPAIAVVMPNGRVPYLYKGTGIGDYPTLEVMLEQVAVATAL